MALLLNSHRFGGTVSYDADAVAYFTAMSVAPDTARKAVINTLVLSLKTGATSGSNIWAKLDALWLLAAHDEQAGKLNAVTPASFTITTGGGAPSFTTDRGFTTDGVDDYLNTNLNVSTQATKFLQNSAAHGVWVRSTGQHANSGWGEFDGTDGAMINPRNPSNGMFFRTNQGASVSQASGTTASSAGFWAGNRSASNATQAYKNGAALTITNATTASTTKNSLTMKIGTANASTYAALEASAAFVGGSLTAAEHLDLYNALAAYMTAIGA
jgi:hypothetical protein